MPNYDFFQHRLCEYFPCHKGADPETFSCLFCYSVLLIAFLADGEDHRGALQAEGIAEAVFNIPPPGSRTVSTVCGLTGGKTMPKSVDR